MTGLVVMGAGGSGGAGHWSVLPAPWIPSLPLSLSLPLGLAGCPPKPFVASNRFCEATARFQSVRGVKSGSVGPPQQGAASTLIHWQR